jgi:hypothetical protein
MTLGKALETNKLGGEGGVSALFISCLFSYGENNLPLDIRRLY